MKHFAPGVLVDVSARGMSTSGPIGPLATNASTTVIEQPVELEARTGVPDAWLDHARTSIGYEIPLTRHFYVYTPPWPLEAFDAEIKQLEREIQELLREVTE